jgi:S-adenosylmethionine decarboxylase
MENNKEFIEAFGLHLTLDGYNCDYDSLINLDKVYSFLDETPNSIGMTKIMQPYVFKYQGKVPEDWGLSGFVLIAESHISIHTFPDKLYLSIDIFSCKRFDLLLAANKAKKCFGIKKYESHVLNRGIEFPREVRPVVEHILGERGEINGKW